MKVWKIMATSVMLVPTWWVWRDAVCNPDVVGRRHRRQNDTGPEDVQHRGRLINVVQSTSPQIDEYARRSLHANAFISRPLTKFGQINKRRSSSCGASARTEPLSVCVNHLLMSRRRRGVTSTSRPSISISVDDVKQREFSADDELMH